MSKSISEVFGLVVRKRREQLGISQEELAARSGIHRTYVSSIELGKVRLGLEIAKNVSSGLGMQLSGLIAEVEKMGSKRSGARGTKT
jgi:transcriptional regulator with XRE-family HTH domain